MANENIGLRLHQPATAWTRLLRSVGYAIPSILALLCGFLTHSAPASRHEAAGLPLLYSVISDPNLCLLLIPIGLSAPFFVSYSTIFTPRPHTFPIEADDLIQERGLFKVLLFIGPGFSILAGALPFWLVNHSMPALPLLMALLLIPLSCTAYGRFLLWTYPDGSYTPLRYQLIWPILLSIGLPFYLGSSFRALEASYIPLIPLLVAAVYACAAEKWTRTRKTFFLYSAASLAIGFFVPIFIPSLRDAFYVFLFAIAVAAYSAVFESWSATARHAAIEGTFGDKTMQFYLGSMAALVLSSICITLLYLLTPLGSVFLWGIGVHSILAFVIWLRAAQPSETLIVNPLWARYKVVMGLVPFVVLVVDVASGSARLNSAFDVFIAPIAFTFVAILWTGLATSKLKDIPPFSVSTLGSYFKNKRLFVENLGMFFLAGFLVSILTYARAEKLLAFEYWSRMRMGAIDVFDLYCVMATLALAYLFVTRHSGGFGVGVTQTIVGMLLAIRMFTSIIIGSSVLMAGLAFRVGLLGSVRNAIPFMLASMGGFALNDYTDSGRDVINRPYRAIPSGRLSAVTVLWIGIATSAAAIVLGCLEGHSWLTKSLYLTASVGVVAYNLVVAYWAAVKTLYTAVLSCIPFVFCICEYHYASVYWLFPFALVVFITGRELAMDIHDLEGDSKVGIRTLPMLWEVNSVKWLSVTCQAAGALLLVPLAVTIGSSLALFVALSLVCVTAVICGARLFSARYLSASIYASWAPMLLAVVLFLMDH